MRKRSYRHRMTKTTKGSVLAIITTIILILTIWIPFYNWITSEETIVLASTLTPTPEPTTPTPTILAEKKEPEVASNEEYRKLIYKTFGEEEGPIAYAIAKAESGLNPNAENCNGDVECSVGLYQINIAKGAGHGAKVHWDKIPGDTLQEKITWLKVPKNNILMAKFLRGSSGFYPWSVYKNGSYKKHL